MWIHLPSWACRETKRVNTSKQRWLSWFIASPTHGGHINIAFPFARGEATPLLSFSSVSASAFAKYTGMTQSMQQPTLLPKTGQDENVYVGPVPRACYSAINITLPIRTHQVGVAGISSSQRLALAALCLLRTWLEGVVAGKSVRASARARWGGLTQGLQVLFASFWPSSWPIPTRHELTAEGI